MLAEAVRRDPQTSFDVNKFDSAIPKSGWPPGISESDFHFAGAPAGKVVEDVG